MQRKKIGNGGGDRYNHTDRGYDGERRPQGHCTLGGHRHVFRRPAKFSIT